MPATSSPSILYNVGMISLAAKRKHLRRPHARMRANRKSGRAISKRGHRCRSAVHAKCSSSKARCEKAPATTNRKRHYHRGQQYSITALTDSSGNVTERYAYSAYGMPTILDGNGTVLTSSADNNRYTYTGREWDETLDLYHFRARMYDSLSGRFLSRDPIAHYIFGLFGKKQRRIILATRNSYQFVSSSPSTLVDPSGLLEWVPDEDDVEAWDDYIETIKDIIDAIKDGNPPVGVGDIIDTIGGGHVDSIIDILTNTGTEGTACNKWYYNVLRSTICSATACSTKGCGDIQTNLNTAGPFTDCLEETLDEQSVLVQIEVKAAMIKLAGILEDNCNKARGKSGCCYLSRGKYRPKPKGKCPNNCIKLRAVCNKPPGKGTPPSGLPELPF